IEVHFEDSVDLIGKDFKDSKHTLVVYTPAIKNSAEHEFFKEHGFTIEKRAAVLGRITKDTYCFAVAGTHGKTTTSTILAHIVDHFEDSVDLIGKDFKDSKHTLVVYTPAIKNSAEHEFFKDHGFTIEKRAAVLGRITKDTYCFAVAGTHGKTTTSTILAHILD